MLRQLKLRTKLKELNQRKKELAEKRDKFSTRKKELEVALEEAKTEEDIKLVTKEVEDLEKELADEDLEKELTEIDEEVSGIEEEIAEIDEKSNREKKQPQKKERGVVKDMEKRTRFFGMTVEERDAFFDSEEIKGFITRAKDIAISKRSVSGEELGIPEVVIDLLRDNMNKYSKLITKIKLKPIKGKARANVMGTVPEAVWVEATGYLNEIDFSIGQVELDGFKIGGFIPISNSTLEDSSDIELGTEIIEMLGQSIGLGIDKAILYGDGRKKPLGIAKRLGQTSKPSELDDKIEWKDLHASNVKKLSLLSTSGADFFGPVVKALGIADPTYAAPGDTPFWCVNHATCIEIKTKALAFNSAAALVSGMANEMPVIGGEMIELPFVPDNEIVGGYGSLYVLAERAGATFNRYDQVRALQDQTVFIGTARYDGKPVIAEGFVSLNFGNSAVTTTAEFEIDYANEEIGDLILAAAAGKSGHTAVTVTGKEESGTTLKYKVAAQEISVMNGDKPRGFTDWDGKTEIAAVAGNVITVIELDANKRAIKVGSCEAVLGA